MNNRPELLTWILPLATAISLACLWRSEGGLSWPPSLDFTGGVRMEYQIDKRSAVRAGLETDVQKKSALERSQEIFLFRLRGFDLSEITVKALGNDRLVVEVPGAEGIERAKTAIGAAATLTFRLITGPPMEAHELLRRPQEERDRYFRMRGQNYYFLVGEALLDEEDINYSGVIADMTQSTLKQPKRETYVKLALRAAAVEKFESITNEHFGERLAICLDDRIESAPMIAARGIREPIITGYERAAARDLAKILRNGPLPVSLNLVSESSVSPSLADDSLNRGLKALLLGAGLVILLLGLAYLDHPALLTTFGICLALEAALLYLAGRMGWLTLNMASLSGIIVLLGISVDNLILIFEELRHIASHEIAFEQRHWLKKLQDAFAAENGVILMASLTTCGALFPLYFLGGPIRNLVEVLLLGIVLAFITNVWFARRLLGKEGFVRPLENAPLRHRPLLSVGFNLYAFRKPVLACYLAALAAAVGLIWVRGVQRGLDFKGGMEIVIASDEGLGTDSVRTLASEYIGERVEVKGLHRAADAEGFHYVVRTTALEGLEGGRPPREDSQREPGSTPVKTAEGLLEELQNKLDVPLRLESVDELGATVVDFNRDTVFWSVLAALALLAAFISAEYGSSYALPVVGALVCDGVIGVGALALLSIPVSIPAVAALLTVLGYSINDSIVLCGHVNRNWKDWEAQASEAFPGAWQESGLGRSGPRAFVSRWMSETLHSLSSRVILTSLTTIGVSVVLWIVGRNLLQDFGAIIMVGVTFGTLSSVSLVAMGMESVLRSRLGQLLSQGGDGPPSAHPTNPTEPTA